MWLRRFTNYLLQHPVQALVLTFLLTASHVASVLGILIAALMTLVKGAVQGAIFTLAAIVPYFFSVYIAYKTGADADSTHLMLWGAVGVAVGSNILTWVFAVMLKRHVSWSNIVQVAVLLGVLVISIVHLIYPNVTEWWGRELLASLKEAVGLLGKGTTITEMQIETINVSKFYASGMITGIVLLNALVQLIFARWWQAFMYKPASLRLELHNIRLSPLAGVLFVLSLGFAYWGNAVVWDIMPVLYLLFAGAGLSVIHYTFGMMKQSPMTWFWLALLYTTILLSMPMSIFILAIIALMDIWLNLRKRLKKVN